MVMKNRIQKKGHTELLRMTWPVVAELLLTGLINTGSQYFLNAFSTDAMAVVGSLSQIVSMVINLYTLVSIGGSILLAPMVGAGRQKDCGKLIDTMLTANLVFGVLVSAVTLCAVYPFLYMMNIEPALYAMGREYLIISLGLSTVQSLLITYTAIFRSFGHMKDVLACNFAVYLTCFFANMMIYYLMPQGKQRLLFYTFSGIIGQATGVIYLHLRLRSFFWKQNKREKPDSGERMRLLKRILHFGIPGGMEGILYLIAQIVIVAMIGSLGTRALLIKAYLGNFAAYMSIGTSAINTAVFVLIGQYLGEKNPEALRSIFREGLAAGILITLTVSAGLIAVSRPVLHLFTYDESIIEQVQALLYLQLIVEAARVLAALAVSGLKAVGETRLPFIMIILGSLLDFAIVYGCGIVLGWGLYGIWLGYLGDLVLRGIVEALRWYKITRGNAICGRRLDE